MLAAVQRWDGCGTNSCMMSQSVRLQKNLGNDVRCRRGPERGGLARLRRPERTSLLIRAP